MPEACSTLVHEWFERVWNQRDATAIDELLAEDAIVHGLEDASGNELRGPEGFKPLHETFCRAFPDLRIEVDDCTTEGDRIAFRCTVRGRHGGEGLGMEATGREVEFTGMGFIRVQDGKIVEAWNTFDFQKMSAQLAGPAEAASSSASMDEVAKDSEEAAVGPKVRRLVPMAFVADVARSIVWYAHLGFTVGNMFTPEGGGELAWAWLESGDANLMVARASDPVVPEQQAVLFYVYTDDVAEARDALVAAGLSPGPISTPFYAPKGEFRLTDPDGYTVMVMHV